jgi:para-nitrobenzyl esterase
MASFKAFIAGLAGSEPAQSEDCLVLKVWTGGLDTNTSRAVMVWVHGGAFTSGSGSWPLYDGTPLASRGDAVVVTVNHRLGPLGYMYLDDVAGDEYRGSGNAGMLDIVQALEWVRDNIASFGGDPSKVLVFGGSGGASKTSALTGFPSAQGLFHRGALLSGPYTRARTRDAAAAITEQFLARLEIKPADVHRLHDIPVDVLLAERLWPFPCSSSWENGVTNREQNRHHPLPFSRFRTFRANPRRARSFTAPLPPL